MERALGRGGGALLVGGTGVGKSLLLATALERASDAGRTVLSVGGASWSSGARAKGYGSLGECLDSIEPANRSGSATDRPLVGVDDAHLVDDASGHRLHRLVAAGSISVLAASRKDAHTPAGIDKLWVDRLIDHVDVGPFDRAQLRDVLHARLGGHTDAATLERLWSATHGNALVLRELVDHAVEKKSLRRVDGVWWWEGLTHPPSRRLSELIRLGLRDLSLDEQELVNTLAVAEPLEMDIAAASGLAHAAESLDLRGIVAVRYNGTRVELRLAVPLSRMVVVSRMSDLTAQRLRRQVADAMERRGARLPEDALRVVSLRIEAGLLPEREQLLVAARTAVRRRMHELAERLCLLALRATDPGKPLLHGASVSDFGEGPEAVCRMVAHAVQRSDAPRESLRAALLLGEVLIGKGRHEEAEAVFDTALSAAVDIPQTEYVAAVHARVVNLAWRLRRVKDAGAVLDRAVAAVGQGQAGVLHGSRALIAMMSDRLRDAVDIGEAVLRAGDVQQTVTQGLVPVMVLARSELGDAAGALELLGRYREPSFDWDGEAAALLVALAARCLWHTGNLREAEEALATTRRYDDADRWPALLQTVLAGARLLRLRGEPQRAVAQLRQAVTLDTCHEWPVTRAWTLAQLGGALAESGQHAEALRTLVEARTVQREAVSHPIADDEIAYDRALVLAHTGDYSGAASAALDLADRAEAQGRTPTALAALHLIARVKENASYRFRSRARQFAARCGGATARVMSDHIQALAEADGNALTKVSRQFGEMGALPLAAEAAAQAARAHRAAGQRRKGREAWATCENLLRGGTFALPPWIVNENRGDMAPLTPREREVAALAATGMSNRDIALRLVVSVRTVENHLHRIYHKLGITERQALHRSQGQETPNRAVRLSAG
ncbi:LuxR C-terminal-related transcriptional regulator [Streptomyces sp. NPDC102283]|uniref:helix-turn-helix transcriptional regulator n=1 Tax=Streptomyces sp. NPDC102283 TaxID=3366155 RepID=UPI003824C007